MEALIGTDGAHMLWWQFCVRAVLVLIFGLLLIRLFARRAFGEQTPLDIIVAIVIGSNFSRALTGNARFFPTLAATAVMLVVFRIVSHAIARSTRFGRLIKGSPVRLARNGELDAQSMAQAGIGIGDIEASVRRMGAAGLDEVDEVVLERSGKLSVVLRKGSAPRE